MHLSPGSFAWSRARLHICLASSQAICPRDRRRPGVCTPCSGYLGAVWPNHTLPFRWATAFRASLKVSRAGLGLCIQTHAEVRPGFYTTVIQFTSFHHPYHQPCLYTTQLGESTSPSPRNVWLTVQGDHRALPCASWPVHRARSQCVDARVLRLTRKLMAGGTFLRTHRTGLSWMIPKSVIGIGESTCDPSHHSQRHRNTTTRPRSHTPRTSISRRMSSSRALNEADDGCSTLCLRWPNHLLEGGRRTAEEGDEI